MCVTRAVWAVYQILDLEESRNHQQKNREIINKKIEESSIEESRIHQNYDNDKKSMLR